MIIGIPKEIKNFEHRVGLIPNYIEILKENGHTVYVQKNAGIHCGFSNESYQKSGAIILDTLKEVYEKSEFIVKVKEPQEEELAFIREKQIIFGFFHFPGNPQLFESLMNSKSICIAYETLQESDGSIPILAPMSAIAGKLGVLAGVRYLNSTENGKGILIGGIPGTSKGNILILGGGFVGTNACSIALGLGANVTMLEINIQRMNELKALFPNLNLLYSNKKNILESIKNADIIISGIHIVGGKPPILINRKMLALMEENTILVDVSIDQGGVFETSKPSSLSEPIFKVDNIIHYCVPNIPTMASKTASEMLSHVSFPYLNTMVNLGLENAIQKLPYLKEAINLYNGKVTNKVIAQTFNKKHCSL